MNPIRKRPYETDLRLVHLREVSSAYNAHELEDATKSFMAFAENFANSYTNRRPTWFHALLSDFDNEGGSFPNTWEGEDGMMTHVKTNFPTPRIGAPIDPSLICNPDSLGIQNNQVTKIVDKKKASVQSIIVSDDDDDNNRKYETSKAIVSDDDDDACIIIGHDSCIDKEASTSTSSILTNISIADSKKLAKCEIVTKTPGQAGIVGKKLGHTNAGSKNDALNVGIGNQMEVALDLEYSGNVTASSQGGCTERTCDDSIVVDITTRRVSMDFNEVASQCRKSTCIQTSCFKIAKRKCLSCGMDSDKYDMPSTCNTCIRAGFKNRDLEMITEKVDEKSASSTFSLSDPDHTTFEETSPYKSLNSVNNSNTLCIS